jgi:hypothetical protein
MLSNWVRINIPVILIIIAFTFFPLNSFGQESVRYGEEIEKETQVRYGTEITEKARVRYGVDISADDIRQVPPGEIIAEEVPSAFEFDMRNYIKLTAYYDDLKDDSLVNPDEILELEEYGGVGEINSQFELSYLKDYQFKADVGYQISSGPGEQQDDNTHFVTNEYYLDLFVAKKAYLRIGKKRQTLGVGWTFSPVDDVLEWPKNVVDPTDFREGKYLASVEVPYADASLSLIYIPKVEYDKESESGQAGIPEEFDFDSPTIGIRLWLLLWDTDVALIYNRTEKIPEVEKDYFGLTLNRYWGDLGTYFEAMAHKGNDLEFVYVNESGSYYFPTGEDLERIKDDDEDYYVNLSIGVNYSLSDGTKFSMEYFRNQEGYNDEEFDLFYEFLEHDSEIYETTNDESVGNKILKANQILGSRLRQNYLSLTFDRPFTFDDFNPHLGAIINLDDSSFQLNGSIEWAIRDDTNITLDTRYFSGGDETEYGLKPDNYKVILKTVYFF